MDNLPLARRKIFFHNNGVPRSFRLMTPLHSLPVFNECYDDRWIRNNGPFKWPAWFPNLNPLDFFLWGYIKNQIYSNEYENNEKPGARDITN